MKIKVAAFPFLMMVFAPLSIFGQPRSISLNEALALAKENNPILVSLRRQVDAARGRALAAKAIPDPQLSVEVESEESSFEGSSIGLSQSFEFPGKRSNRKKAANSAFKKAQLEYEREIRFLQTSIKKSYYQCLADSLRIQALESNLELLKDLIEITNASFRAGKAEYFKVLRVNTEKALIQNKLIAANTDLMNDKRELGLLIGLSQDTGFRLQQQNLDSVANRLSPETMLAIARQENLTLKIADIEQNRAKQILALAKASYGPELEIGGRKTLRAGDYSVEAGTSIPLYFFWGQRGEVNEAKAELAASQSLHSFTRQVVQTAINNAYAKSQTLRKQLNFLKEGIITEIENEQRAAVSAYGAGELEAVEMMDIYQTYRNVQFEYIETTLNYLKSLSELETAGEERSDHE